MSKAKHFDVNGKSIDIAVDWENVEGAPDIPSVASQISTDEGISDGKTVQSDLTQLIRETSSARDTANDAKSYCKNVKSALDEAPTESVNGANIAIMKPNVDLMGGTLYGSYEITLNCTSTGTHKETDDQYILNTPIVANTTILVKASQGTGVSGIGSGILVRLYDADGNTSIRAKLTAFDTEVSLTCSYDVYKIGIYLSTITTAGTFFFTLKSTASGLQERVGVLEATEAANVSKINSANAWIAFNGGVHADYALDSANNALTITLPDQGFNIYDGSIGTSLAYITKYKSSVFTLAYNQCLVYDKSDGTLKVISYATSGDYYVILSNSGLAVDGMLAKDYYARRLLYSINKCYYDLEPKIKSCKAYWNCASGYSPSISNSRVLTLLHFSDIHGDTNALANIVKFATLGSNYINDILSTGDNVERCYEQTWNWDSVSGADKILNCIGNHDGASLDDQTKVSDMSASYTFDVKTAQECYEQQFKNYIANWGVNYTENLCYYYKDYTSQGIRLIVLDCNHESDEQMAWLVSTLESARTSGLAVIIAKHGAHKDCTPIDCTFNHLKDSTFLNSKLGGYSYNSSVDAVDTFINNGGKFVCWLVGHLHTDILALTEGSHKPQLVIGISTSKTTYTGDHIKTTKTETENLFNIVNVDATDGYIKIIRVGCNVDVIGQHQDMVVYDYVNHTLISNS